jgi:hypothetical protein
MFTKWLNIELLNMQEISMCFRNLKNKFFLLGSYFDGDNLKIRWDILRGKNQQ